jgi:hypothetical protein
MYYPKLDIVYDDVSKGFVDIKKASGVIARNTLNTIAFLVRKNDIQNIQSNFILRNKFTISSIRVEKAVGKNINTMQSKTGILDRASYMVLQETGGIKKSKRGGAIAMAQVAARGGLKRHVVNKPVYLREIKKKTLRWSSRGGSRKASLIAMAYVAEKTGMFFKYKKNIYKVTSFTKNKNKIQFKKTHLYYTGKQSARIKREPHFEPALKQPIKDAQNIFNSQCRKLLKQKYIV